MGVTTGHTPFIRPGMSGASLVEACGARLWVGVFGREKANVS
jgi:hypothetical protein